MIKILEMLGFVLVVVMFASFVGLLVPTIESGLTPMFWGCAITILLIIIYRTRMKKRKEKGI